MDYLRFTGPVEKLEEVKGILRDSFGELVEGGPGGPYLHSLKVGTSSGVFWGSRLENLKGRLKVEISGSMLVDIELPQIIELARSFVNAELSSTRIDVAVDFFNEPGLIDQVLEGVLQRELVGAKTHKLHVGGASGKRNNHGIEIGKRGKGGSGRFVRIYDKGLETATMEQGKWVRWEVEFTTNHAAFIASKLAYLAEASDAAKFLLEIAFGSIDFREPGDKHITRRTRKQWYERIIGSVKPQMIRIVRHKPDLDGYKGWVRKAVLPKLEKYANELGVSVYALMNYLGQGRNEAPQRVLQSEIFRQLEKSIKTINHPVLRRSLVINQMEIRSVIQTIS